MPVISDAKREILTILKRRGACSAAEMAEDLGVTDVAVRQHLDGLAESNLVVATPRPPMGRGRPGLDWALTDAAEAQFPDAHAELTVGLIEATREALGQAGLMRIVEVRARDQVDQYKALMPPASVSLGARVRRLAQQRTREGYMAEVVRESRGVYLLTEHHCPICAAARCCTGLCTAELEVFREVLGRRVKVERTEHLLSDGDRCVYRISESA